MSALKKVVELAALNETVAKLSAQSAVDMEVWHTSLKDGDRKVIDEARLRYEVTVGNWMDAHERLAEIVRSILRRE